MTTLSFHTLDVFTRTPYAGNPLAVVHGGEGLSNAQMQRVAAEFNLSETVFVLPPQAGGAARLRIFTPALELPFAGHPTIGTACLLAALRPELGDAFVLEENVGPVPVTLRRAADGGHHAELTAAIAPERREPDFDVAALPAVLGLDTDTDPGTAHDAITRVELCGCGTPFVLVHLRQPELLAGITFDATAARRLLAPSWAHALYVVAPGYEPGTWRARMFAPDLGVGEDPATGAAAVALAGALALADARDDAQVPVTVMQGVEMGRPSELFASYERRGGAVTAVRVGGHAVRMAEGTLRAP